MPQEGSEATWSRFGARLRQLRAAATMSQRQVAEAAEINFTYLSKVENGRTEPPSEATIRRLAEILNGNPDELLALSGKISPTLRDVVGRDPRLAYLINALPALNGRQLDQVFAAAGLLDIPLPPDESEPISKRARRRER